MTLTSARTFGVEIECLVPARGTREGLAAALRAAGIACYVEGYGHSVPRNWKVVTDASLGDTARGAEIVSPVLSGEAGLNEVRKAAAAAKAYGCEVTTKCGFHVHVGAADLALNELRKLAINFVQVEPAFDAIMPPSRRRNANDYIKSNRTSFGGSYDGENFNKAIDAYRTATTKHDLVRVVSAVRAMESGRSFHGDTRYRKLNFWPLIGDPSDVSRRPLGTVEFRQHSGTVDADKAAFWVELVVTFVDRTKATANNPVRKRKVTTQQSAAAELSALLRWLGASAEMKAFYVARRKALAERGVITRAA